MRVVHIITGLRTGGAERLLYDRSHFTEHEMAVITLAEEGTFADRLRSEGVPVHFIGMSSNRDLMGLLRLTALLRRMRPDVVHVHLYRSLLFGRLAARLAGIRAIVATEHSALPDRTEGRPATSGVKTLYRVAEAWGRTTIAVSNRTKEILVDHWGIPAERIEVVANGVDTARLAVPAGTRERVRRELGTPDDAPLVLGVGRLTPGKHFDTAVRAVAGMPGVHLVLVGEGESEQDLRRLADELGAQDRVVLAGTKPDVAPYYAAADAMLSMSDVETYGLAIVEAYAAGLPVVYRQSPAADDLRARHDDGRLIPVDDDTDTVQDAVMHALTLPIGIDTVSARAREGFEYAAVSRALDAIERRVAGA